MTVYNVNKIKDLLMEDTFSMEHLMEFCRNTAFEEAFYRFPYNGSKERFIDQMINLTKIPGYSVEDILYWAQQHKHS